MPEAVSSPTKVETCLNLLRHLNPSQAETNLNLLGEALPELKASLREVVDVPSKIIVASEANNREFLAFELAKSCSKCYRCPWDDKFYTVSSVLCSECNEKEKDDFAVELKQLERSLNEAVSTYSSLYYGSYAITSAYVEGSSVDSAFNVAILIKKRADVDDEHNSGSFSKATWDSVHLFEISNSEEEDEQWVYRHTATVMLSFDNSVENLKNIKLSGNLIRQNESKHQKFTDFSHHLMQIGSLLEESESRLRNDLQSVYFGRTHDIVNEVRSAMPEGYLRNQNDFREEMMAKLGGRVSKK